MHKPLPRFGNRTTMALAAIAMTALLAGCGAEAVPSVEPPPAPPACRSAHPPSPRPLAEGELARSVADAWLQRHAPAELGWDWGPAVLAYGLLDLYEATGDDRYRDYVRDWLDHYAGAEPIFWSDTAAPAAAAARLARYGCDPRLLDVVERTHTYIAEGAPRTEAGGIAHLGFLMPDHPQLWVDSLFMFGSVLLHRGELRGTTADWDRFAEQVVIFADELQDPNGWFRHALLREAPFPPEPVFWARGNAWIASILPRLLDVLPGDHPRRERLEEILSDLLGAVARTQDTSGLWWTVANRPGEAYLETSASALFADGLRRGAALGLVPEATADDAYARALSAVAANIRPRDGLPTVTGTSTGTQPSRFEGYAAIPVTDDVDYGVGAVLLMLTSP